jgi:hypothetical protein
MKLNLPLAKWGPKAQATLAEVNGQFQRLMTATGSEAGKADPDTTAVLAACDELAVGSRDARAWYLGHPCPRPDVGREFAAVLAAYSSIATSMLKAIPDKATNWDEVTTPLILGYYAEAQKHADKLGRLLGGR